MGRPSKVLVLERSGLGPKSASSMLTHFGIDHAARELLDAGGEDTSGAARIDFTEYDAVLVNDCTAGRDDDRARMAAALERLAQAARKISTLLLHDREQGLEAADLMEWGDVITAPAFPAPVFPAQVACRMISLLRLDTMAREFERRIVTAAKYGVDAPTVVERPAEVEDGFVLVFGEGRNLAAIEQALAQNATLVGAFTPITGIDYLTRRSFDLVVVEVGSDARQASDFVAQLRSNSRFYSLPVIAVGPPDDTAWCGELFEAGVTEILRLSDPPGDLRARAERLIRESRYRERLRTLCRENRRLITNDALTGLYSRGFLLEHLDALIAWAGPRADRFSLVWFEIADLAPLNLRHGYATGDRVIRQVGETLHHLVRGADLVARHGAGRFVVVMPDTRASAALSVHNRILGVIRSTEFAVPEIHQPLRVDLRSGIASYRPGDTPQMMIGRAAASTL